MAHQSYPTPVNPLNDVSSDFRHARMEINTLHTLGGKDLLELQDIAFFWACQHGNPTHNRAWKPVYARIRNEIVTRLDATKR